MAPLSFDPIDEAARHWGQRWGGVTEMRAVTSIMRAHQLLLARLDDLLRQHDLTFSRYEALVLLKFSSNGSLPMGKIGERLQVHATSVSPLIRKLQTSGFVDRIRDRGDGRTYLASITSRGQEVAARATADLLDADFGINGLSQHELDELFVILRKLRESAGDF